MAQRLLPAQQPFVAVLQLTPVDLEGAPGDKRLHQAGFDGLIVIEFHGRDHEVLFLAKWRDGRELAVQKLLGMDPVH